MIRLFLKFSIGGWAAAALSLLTLPIITALIRPDEFGRAAMFTLAVGLGSQLIMLGTDQSFAREFYRQKDAEGRARLLRETLAVPLVLAIVSTLAVAAFGSEITTLLFGLEDRYAAGLIAIAIVLTLIERFATLILRMEQRAGAFSALRLAFAAISFLTTLGYALLVDAGFRAIATGQVIGLGLVSLLAIVLARRSWRTGPLSGPGIRSALVYGIPFVPTFAAMWVVEGIDKVALRHFADFTELGIFSAAYRFIALVSLLQAGFSTFWVPVSFDLFERDPDHARAAFSRGLQMMAPLLVLGGLAVLLAKELIVGLFAADFRDAARVMPFLLLVPIMYALSDISSGGINLKRRPRWHLLIAILTASANAMLNLLLVPPLGALGAAVATGSSYLLFFALRTLVSQRLLPLDLRLGRLLAVLTALIACCAAHSFASDAAASYVITASAMVLCGVLYSVELGDMAGRLARRLREADGNA